MPKKGHKCKTKDRRGHQGIKDLQDPLVPLDPSHPLEVLGDQLLAHLDQEVEEGWILLHKGPGEETMRRT